MGDITQDKNEGACCSICQTYFIEGHGYPVACEDCYTEDCEYAKAINKEI